MTSEATDLQALNRTSGWVLFSGTAMALAASANLIFAITVLLNSDWIVLTSEALIRFDLTTVGVIYLIFAAFQFFVAMGIFQGVMWARILGITVAWLSLLSQMAFMSLYPAWAWLVIIIDGLIIWGLTVHGDEVAEL
jgi:hypothetical protein